MASMTLQPPQQQASQPGNQEQFVINQVLSELGTPKNLFRVDAKPLWNNRYRVNVFCAVSQDRALDDIRITDSFHVSLQGDGIVSSPQIVKKY